LSNRLQIPDILNCQPSIPKQLYYSRQLTSPSDIWGRRGRDRMVVGFTIMCAISVKSCEFESH